MAVITKELALKIAAKLKADIDERPTRPHDLAKVYHEGRLIAVFGIRRGSKKELGHDHIPRDLHIRPNQARLLGQCPWSKDDWIAALQERGLIA
jgi:hypothetical protein